jgi:protein-L-isoaspartate(D-aspartate) O-methyltransferase
MAEALVRDGIEPRIAEAIARVPRHEFVPAEMRERAYEDSALPIGCDQTISQPFIVGFMTQLLEAREGARVLDVGTGSGYQAAVLAELGAAVFSVEIVPQLSFQAARALRAAGYELVHLRVADAADGWADNAPYDGILVAAAGNEVPDALLDQLTIGGRMAMPLEEADGSQWIWRITKRPDGGIHRERTLAVRFVPLTGRRAPENAY